MTNGDFSHGFEDWHPSIWGDAAGSFTVEKGMAKLAVTNPGTHTYNIMLYEAVALQGDTDYTLEFDIKSDVVSRKFEIVLEHYGEPYNKHLWQKETTSATAGEAKHFTVKFRLPPADLKSKLGFHFGSAAYGQGAVWIGDISIRK